MVGDGGHQTVMIGLDDENLARLQQNQPIKFNLRKLDPTPGAADLELPDIDVVIAYADDALLGFLGITAEMLDDEGGIVGFIGG